MYLCLFPSQVAFCRVWGRRLNSRRCLLDLLWPKGMFNTDIPAALHWNGRHKASHSPTALTKDELHMSDRGNRANSLGSFYFLNITFQTLHEGVSSKSSFRFGKCEIVSHTKQHSHCMPLCPVCPAEKMIYTNRKQNLFCSCFCCYLLWYSLINQIKWNSCWGL